jgi:hypothetical protein
MKTISVLLLSAASMLAQSASATFQFAGEPVGFTVTVNPNGFTPEINGLESQLNSTCSGLTLASGITSGSTSYTLAGITSQCVFSPGNGLAIGCASSGGGCAVVSIIKAAGCNTGTGVCPVIQGTLGTAPGTYPSGTPITVLQFGTGGATVCALIPILQTFAQRGAVTVTQPANSANASTAIAAQNATITTAAATILSLINGAFGCAATL